LCSQHTLDKFDASVDGLIKSHQECAAALHHSQLHAGSSGLVGDPLRKVALEEREGAQPYITLLPTVMRIFMAINKVGPNQLLPYVDSVPKIER